jgi:hypothetical protein
MPTLKADYTQGQSSYTSYHHGDEEGISVSMLGNCRMCIHLEGAPRLKLFLSADLALSIRDQIDSLQSSSDPSTPVPTTAALAECSPLEEPAL